MIGQRVDDYRVLAVLGEGGFGTVYLAVGDDGEEVALKLAGPDPMHAERLRREGRALARIHHANVVRLLGNGEHEGRPYLVLEYLGEHESLADVIEARKERGDGFGEGEAHAILDKILDGLEAAHAAGVVHRDVKPENVMLARGSGPAHARLQLIDFGLAKLRPRVQASARAEGRPKTPTRRTMALGTPTHMAPEQIVGRGLGPWTDLFAVGVIAFELLTGRLPFEGDSASALIADRTDSDPDVAGLAPELPRRLQRVLAKALAHDPKARYRSVAAMRADLDLALTALPGPAPFGPLDALMIDPPEPQSDRRADRTWRFHLAVVSPFLVAALLALVALAFGRGAPEEVAPEPAAPDPIAWANEVGRQVAAAIPKSAPTPEAPPPDPLLAVAERARTCEASPEELRALAERCEPELGCEVIQVTGDIARGATLPVPNEAQRVVLIVGAADGVAACGTRARRSRAIVAGAWDTIDPAWGAYVQPRVVLEARAGRSTKARHVLRERGAATPIGGTSLCIEPEEIAASTFETFEELRFQAADTRRLGEEGRFPCQLEVRALALGQPKRPAM